ncbi:MAG: lipocalin family protein [Bacteroidota bacterium]
MMLFLTLTAQGQNDLQEKHKNYLTGHWKIDTMYMDMDLSEEYMVVFKEKFKELKEKTEFIFYADGRYKKLSIDPERTGKWRITPDGKTIIIEFDDSEEVSRTRISSLTENKLDMQPAKSATNNRVLLYKTE